MINIDIVFVYVIYIKYTNTIFIYTIYRNMICIYSAVYIYRGEKYVLFMLLQDIWIILETITISVKTSNIYTENVYFLYRVRRE